MGRISSLIGWLEWYLCLGMGGKPKRSERIGLRFSGGLGGGCPSSSSQKGGAFREGDRLSQPPISPVQGLLPTTQASVRSVPTLPVLDARTAEARCLLALSCRMLPLLAAQSSLPLEWRIEARDTWEGPSFDTIPAAGCFLRPALTLS